MNQLDSFERIARLFLAAVAAFAAWAIFEHPALRLVSAVFAAFALYEAGAARCVLYGRLADASGALSRESRYLLALVTLQAALAYEWLGAGISKIAGGTFVSDLPGTLAAFAAKNPYPWYADFLTGFATANAALLGPAIEWGQVAIGVVLAGSAVKLLLVKNPARRRIVACAASLALVGGMILNANFYLAAGWMSPSTHGLNLVMFWAQAALVYAWLGMSAERRV